MKTFILLSLLQLGAASGDAYWTNHNMQSPYPNHYERNPIARHFVGTTSGCAVYFGLTSAMNIGIAFNLHRRGKDRYAKLMLVGGIAADTFGATTSKLGAK